MRTLAAFALIVVVAVIAVPRLISLVQSQMHRSACVQSKLAWSAATGFRIYPDRYYDVKNICSMPVVMVSQIEGGVNNGEGE